MPTPIGGNGPTRPDDHPQLPAPLQKLASSFNAIMSATDSVVGAVVNHPISRAADTFTKAAAATTAASVVFATSTGMLKPALYQSGAPGRTPDQTLLDATVSPPPGATVAALIGHVPGKAMDDPGGIVSISTVLARPQDSRPAFPTLATPSLLQPR